MMRIKLPRNDLLKPAQVYSEYGIKPRALAYMRELTADTSELVGPLWINPKNTDIIYYRREWIEAWIRKDTVNVTVPTIQNEQKTTFKQNITNIHNFQKPQK